MKKIKFIADKISYETNLDEGSYMIGFSDNGDTPKQYVILQRTIEFDAQDIELGLNSYYFEYSDQSNSGYNICSDIRAERRAERRRIFFALNKNTIENIDEIEIIFDENRIEDWNEFKAIFEKITKVSI